MAKGLTRVVIYGDGHCFFRCLSELIGSDFYAKPIDNIRNRIAEELMAMYNVNGRKVSNILYIYSLYTVYILYIYCCCVVVH